MNMILRQTEMKSQIENWSARAWSSEVVSLWPHIKQLAVSQVLPMLRQVWLSTNKANPKLVHAQGGRVLRPGGEHHESGLPARCGHTPCRAGTLCSPDA